VRARLIALVDDDAAVRKSLSRLLRAAGFLVTTYASGEEFLGRQSAEEPDCLLLDISLAGMSGPDVWKELLHRGVNTPVVFITALDDPTTIESVSRSAAVACLLKPIEETALIDAITRAVGTRGDA
jgi:FixJ family two-component response regulator